MCTDISAIEYYDQRVLLAKPYHRQRTKRPRSARRLLKCTPVSAHVALIEVRFANQVQ
jgi:hypothetical protein